MKPFTGADLLRAIGRRIQGARPSETAAGGLLRRLKNPALVAAYLFWRAARNGGKPPRLSDLDWDRLPDAEHGFTVAVEPGEGAPPSGSSKLVGRLSRGLESRGRMSQRNWP